MCGRRGNYTDSEDDKQQSASDDLLHVNLSLLCVNLFVEYGSVNILAGFGAYARARIVNDGEQTKVGRHSGQSPQIEDKRVIGFETKLDLLIISRLIPLGS